MIQHKGHLIVLFHASWCKRDNIQCTTVSSGPPTLIAQINASIVRQTLLLDSSPSAAT
jgi:hypothetical protein